MSATFEVNYLELIDPTQNHRKFYACWFESNGERAWVAYGRIGAKGNYQSKKPFDVSRKLNEKMGEGYLRKWIGTVLIPEPWANAPGSFAEELTRHVALARAGGAQSQERHERPATPVAEKLSSSGLAELVDDARALVSDLAVSFDSSLPTWAELLGRVEAATDQFDALQNYMEVLRVMVNAGGARVA